MFIGLSEGNGEANVRHTFPPASRQIVVITGTHRAPGTTHAHNVIQTIYKTMVMNFK